jgi:hypothetical protein
VADLAGWEAEEVHSANDAMKVSLEGAAHVSVVDDVMFV